jgi:YD repeat-containing protein
VKRVVWLDESPLGHEPRVAFELDRQGRHTLDERYIGWSDGVIESRTEINRGDDGRVLCTRVELHGGEVRQHEWTYDDRGRPLLGTVHEPDGSSRPTVLFEYDDAQRLVRRSRCEEDGTWWAEVEGRYDDRGRLVTYTELPDRTTRFDFGSHGRIAAVWRVVGDVQRLSMAFDYDARGRLVRSRIFGPDGAVLRDAKHLEEGGFYTEDEDANGQLMRSVAYAEPGAPLFEAVWHADGRLRWVIESQIEYDARGNWIARHRRTSPSGACGNTSSVRREIEYWD